MTNLLTLFANNILPIFLAAGAGFLLTKSLNEPFEFKRGRLQKRLTDLATDEAAAKWAVESWAEALGVL